MKLESQKIAEIIGEMDECQRWKSRTERAFDKSG